MMEQSYYLLTGVLAGILAGLLGIGGGVVVVPILDKLLASHFSPELSMHMAVGTSLAIMIFTALSSAFAYYRRGLIIWPLFYKFTPGLLLGIGAGSLIAMYLSSETLRSAFAVFIFILALHMFFSKKIRSQIEREGLRSPPLLKVGEQANVNQSRLCREESSDCQAGVLQLPSFKVLIAAGFVVGMISAFLGIGGGTIMVPFFMYCNVQMHKATGTSAICGLPLAMVGTITSILTGWFFVQGSHGALHLPTGTTGFVYWPAVVLVAMTSILFAPLGTRIAVWLPNVILKRVFAIFLVFVGINLLLS